MGFTIIQIISNVITLIKILKNHYILILTNNANITYELLPINQRHKIDIDKQVDDKGRPKGLAAVGHIAE